ncbi:phenoloxidase-activating factor 2 isoform X2 [Pieris rapae]|uniref:phenoloxidase-activating factor 2 isoform X2 n=1 Tax=Pieris rapae TaxID=64459 RepID=UPI001E28105F|nr:phenoloxidase-activating factor 2 isoform X2 [Pieris rapae]
MRYILFFCLFPLIYCNSIDDLTDQWIKDVMNSPQTHKSRRSGPNLTPSRKLDLTPKRESNPSPVRKPNLQPSEQVGRTCLTKNNDNGECVSYYLCDENSTIIDDGADLLDLRDGSKACSHYLEVCCELGDIKDSGENTDSVEDSNENSFDSAPAIPNPTPPNKQTPLNNPVPQRPFTLPNNPSAKPSTLSSTDANDVSRAECGWSNIEMSPYKPKNPAFRPTEITSAFYGEYPFVVAVMLRSDSDVWSSKYYVGGGALIHYRVVLTTAHGIEKLQANQLKCRAGEYDVQTVKEQYLHQERNVNKVVIHEDYYRTSLYNDVALLFLETEFTAAANIGVACLASVFPPVDDCYSMGWGRDVPIDRRGNFVAILKKVPLPLVSAKDCEYLLQTNSRLGPYFELHNSLTCAGGESMVDTCTGDGGSPLVCAVETSGIEKRYVVTGLVAYGLGCGKIGVPGVYVNIPHLYNWVTNQLDREHVDKKFVL